MHNHSASMIKCTCCALVLVFSSAASSSHATTSSDISLAKALGWVANGQGICGGYYKNPLQAYTRIPLLDLNTATTQIHAQQTHLSFFGTSQFSGHVTIEQPGRSLLANEVYFYRDAKTGKITNMDLLGNIRIEEPNLLLQMKQAHFALDTQTGQLTQILYRILLRNTHIHLGNNQQMPVYAWGTASRAEQTAQGLLILRDTSYSTCAPTHPFWQVTAKKIVLDRDKGRGKAYGAWLRFRDTPILYTPYLGFPIDDRRESGFLFPSITMTSQSGWQLGVPYYWNLAPNYDVLFTPVFLEKRGLLLNTQFRYLTPHRQGTIHLSYLPYDREAVAWAQQNAQLYSNLPKKDRLMFSWQEDHTWSSRWHSSIDVNWVGDDYYLADFNQPSTIAINQLAQKAEVEYQGDVWDFKTRILRYQTLHPENQAQVSNPYNSLPEITLNSREMTFHGFHYQLNNQLTYFQRVQDPGQETPSPRGFRLHLTPSISYPFINEAGYFIPRLQLDLTQYQIAQQVGGLEKSIQRILPIFNFDTGLNFDRLVHSTFGTYRQTLEPRLFYLYVPYRDQSNIPLFDSALIPFSYDSLFLTNRFSGADRIGDANQLSLALSTRLLDELTGAEKLRASIGVIYYFVNRRVSLNDPLNMAEQTTDWFANPSYVVGATSPTTTFSPIAGQLNYNFAPKWSTTADIAWDPASHSVVNAALNLQYHPTPLQVFNLNYGHIRFGDPYVSTPPTPPDSHKNDFNRIGFSFATPLKNRWSTVGGWNYNISHRSAQSFFAGLQYDSCCWAFRIVTGRTFYALNQDGGPIFSNVFYFQWQLKGLSTVGISDITHFLTQNIPGYQDDFQSGSNFL